MDDVDTSATISLEEEMQEGYEPTQQEILEYALHLGMDLASDQRYFDIARAGLKAPMPPEWRPCQKMKNGQPDFFYKNSQTGEVSYEHPCDLMFRKRFLDAKALDSKRTSKKSGINKFKQAVESQRDDDVLLQQEEVLQQKKPQSKAAGLRAAAEATRNQFQSEYVADLPEDRSFLIESQPNLRQRTQDQFFGNEQNPSIQQSQQAQEQINLEFAQKLREYENEKKAQNQTLQQQLNSKYESREQEYLNETNPDLAKVKKQYDQRVIDQQERYEVDKKRLERRIQEEMEDDYLNLEDKLKTKSDADIKAVEEQHDKRFKSSLKQFEQDQRYQNLDLKKKIEMKKRQVEESDRKTNRDLDDKRRKVREQGDEQKLRIKEDRQKQLAQMDQELYQLFKTEKERFAKQLRDHCQQETQVLKSQINELKQEHEILTQSIRDEFRLRKQQSSQQLAKQMKMKIDDYEIQERNKVDQQIKQHQEGTVSSAKQDAINQFQLKKESHQQQLKLELKNHEQLRKSENDKAKDNLQELKKKRFHNLKSKYPRSTSADSKEIDREIDLFMEADKVKLEIESTEEDLKRIQRLKEQQKERLNQLHQVSVKFDLSKEAHSSELIKYELEHKQYLVQKLQEKLEAKTLESEQLLRDLEIYEQRVLAFQQSTMERAQNKQMDQVMQSVSQLKDLLVPQYPNQESKVQQSLFNMKESQMGKSVYKNKSSVGPPTVDYVKEFRRWQGKIVEERVQLNRKKEECKQAKGSLALVQSRLLKEQNQLRSEIQETNMSYHQPNNVKRELLKKMKHEIQEKLRVLAAQVLSLNEKRAILRQKDQALSKIESVIDRAVDDPDPQTNIPKVLESIGNLYELYWSIGNQQPESPAVEQVYERNKRSISDIKFHDDLNEMLEYQLPNPDEFNESVSRGLTAPPNLKDAEYKPPFQKENSNKLVTFNAYDTNSNEMKKSSSGIRYQLIEHKDWLQNCKYQLSKNISRSPESRRQLTSYSQLMLMKP